MESALGLRVVNGIVWVTPTWMRFPEFVTVLVSPVTVLALATRCPCVGWFRGGSPTEPPTLSTTDRHTDPKRGGEGVTRLGGTVADMSLPSLGERPFPSTLVGDETFVRALDHVAESGSFPQPDAGLVPELTKARFVAATARDEGNERYADRVEQRRDQPFDPLDRFDAVTVLSSEDRRESLDEAERERLRSVAGFDETGLSPDDERELVFTELLTDRERTFFHYPGPPGHVIEEAAARGRESLDTPPAERAADAPDEHATYVHQRATVEAVAAGGRELATEASEAVADQLREEDSLGWPYDDTDEYAATVAFNAALAAESILEANGELVTPP